MSLDIFCCSDHQRWNQVTMREHLKGPEHLCEFCILFTLRVSVSVWNETEKISTFFAQMLTDTHQSRSVVEFSVAQSLRILVCLFPFSFQGRAFCIVGASYGHVSLIVDQLDWQCCRFPLFHCCGVVVGLLVSRCET